MANYIRRMMTLVRGCCLPVWILILQQVGVLAAEDAGAAGARTEIAILTRADRGELEMRHRDRRVLLYVFKADEFKPYVRELFTLGGINVFRDAPADHLHHHGLMYAIRVNGHNFWEEASEAGRERSVEAPLGSSGRSREGFPQASFGHLIHWVAHNDRDLTDTAPAALLIERRTITVTINEAQQEVALQWRGEFEVGRGAGGKAALTGSNYNGLGLRFPASFDRVARFQNSENLRYNPPNQQTILPARWTAVSGAVEGRDASIAFFARPESTAGTTKFFSMLEPFTYLAVTQSLNEAPLQYSIGDRFSVTYLVAVYPAAVSFEFLKQRAAAWAHSESK